MKKFLVIAMTASIMCLGAAATEFKTFENKIFSIGYPADWEETYTSDESLNVASPDDEVRFSITYNEQGPMKNQLKEAVDNWVYMRESHGHKVDQKLVREDYALVRTILTDEDDGTKSVEVWYVMISHEPQGFSGTINCPLSRANEATDTLVEMLATLAPKQ